MEELFYVYLHIDPRNNEVFYVGKGKNNRAKSFYKQQRNLYHFNTLNKLTSLGYIENDIVYIYLSNLNEIDAFYLEMKLIKKYKPKCNFTDGGEGASGRDPWNKGKQCLNISSTLKQYYKHNKQWNKGKTNVYTEETRQNMSISHKEYLKTNSNSMQGKQHTEESKLKMRNKKLGKNLSEKHKSNISKSLKKIRKGNLNPAAKTFWIQDSFGNIYKTDCLKTFCIDNNLNYECMAQVSRGKNKQHKGFIILDKRGKNE